MPGQASRKAAWAGDHRERQRDVDAESCAHCRRALRNRIMRAYHVQPWDVGLEPVPRRVRAWRKVTWWRTRQTLTPEA